MALRASILLVDDQPENFDVVQALLHGEGYELNYAASGKRALERLSYYIPDVILMDVMMPDMDGLEVCRRIKANPEWRNIPVIILTALTAKEDLARCLDAGADDFISKPVDKNELRARVRSMVRVSTQYFEIQKLCTDLKSVNATLSSFNELLEAQVRQRTHELEHSLMVDRLTLLPSRRALKQRLRQAITDCHKHNTPPFAVVCLDCDQFKLINASLGHEMGDRLLKAVAQRLSAFGSEASLVARLGGDEFCFLLPGIESEAGLHAVAQQILALFKAPFEVGNVEIFLSASLGLTLFRPGHRAAEDPLQEADTAMHRAKKQGKASYQLFSPHMHQAALGRLQLEQDMQRSLKQGNFLVYYQPVVNLAQQTIVGFEALVRWQHPQQGMVSPNLFIPCAEETGLVVPLGLLVLREACQQLRHWQDTLNPNLTMNVNLSVRQFNHPSLLEDIDAVLADTSIDPGYLKLEITESAIMENPDTAMRLTEALRSRKIQLSIDDFGTGYSSLSYLSRFPVGSIKIDQSFIRNLDTHKNAKIVQVVIALGHALGMAIVAEGIETSDHLASLQQWGCELGQGYHFAKPLSAQAASQLLSTHRPAIVDVANIPTTQI